MRRALVIVPALVLFAAAPSLAADATVTVGDDFFQTPGSPDDINDKVAINPGDTVTWDWNGVDAHNVTSTPNRKQIERFRSSTQSGSDKSFQRRITNAGRFTYLCTEHPDTMKGTVIVGSDDDVRPKLTKVKARASGSGVKVSFKLSERSVVTLRLSGAKSRKVVKVLGSGKRSIKFKNLPAGDYKARLTAKDGFANSGKKSKSFSLD